MASLELFNLEPSVQRMLFADLGDSTREFFDRISELDTGAALLRFMREHPRTYMTADDVAFEIQEPPDSVTRDLSTLEELGVVRVTQVSDVVLYSFAANGKYQRMIDELCTWQDRWEKRLALLKQMVLGRKGAHGYLDDRAPDWD